VKTSSRGWEEEGAHPGKMDPEYSVTPKPRKDHQLAASSVLRKEKTPPTPQMRTFQACKMPKAADRMVELQEAQCRSLGERW
jgi:hypothetical protein